MTGHGPDAATFEKACAADTRKPDYIENTMAIMFETRAVIRPVAQALDSLATALEREPWALRVQSPESGKA